MPEYDPRSHLTRREILHLIAAFGGLTAFSSFLQACTAAGPDPTEGLRFDDISTPHDPDPFPSPALSTNTVTTESTVPQSTSTPIEEGTPEKEIARLAFVKTSDRSSGVRKAIELIGMNPASGKRIFIKPNFNSSDAAPGSTHPQVLRSLVTLLIEMGAQAITVGDRSGMGDTRRVMGEVGAFDLASELGFDTLVFDELDEEDWVMVNPPGSHWERGFPFVRQCLEAEMVVQACCLKTHRFGGHFTLSLKNSVGLVAQRTPQDTYNYMNELHSSRFQRTMIAEINTAYTPDLIVMDGVEAFISGGPDRGDLVESQVILAGTDRVAMDAVGVALLRYHGCRTEVAEGKIFEQEQLTRAIDLGLGVNTPDKIELLTPDPESAAYAGEVQAILSAG